MAAKLRSSANSKVGDIIHIRKGFGAQASPNGIEKKKTGN